MVKVKIAIARKTPADKTVLRFPRGSTKRKGCIAYAAPMAIEVETAKENSTGERYFKAAKDLFKLSKNFYGGVLVRIRVDGMELPANAPEAASITLNLEQAEALTKGLLQRVTELRSLSQKT
jgi:hypothetical protein